MFHTSINQPARSSYTRLQTQCYHFHVSQAGYVLVGGRSSRMGRDKALLPFRGGPLAQSVARAVEMAAGSATLVGHPHRYRHLGFPAIPDRYPGQGPLGGILTALKHTSASWNLLAACDMPGLSAEFLRRLLETAEHSGAAALLPAGPSGRAEPLCAVYHRRILPALETAFGNGVRHAAAALQAAGAAVLPVPEVAVFQNVNTPREWAAYGA
jgi:molybdopterin-guanine dinucleotide biosynthesis protein A